MKTVTVVLSANVNYNNQVRRKAGEELEIDEKDLEWFQKRELVKEVKGAKPDEKGSKEPTVTELKARAEELGLTGYANLKKAELLALVSEAEAKLAEARIDEGEDDDPGEEE